MIIIYFMFPFFGYLSTEKKQQFVFFDRGIKYRGRQDLNMFFHRYTLLQETNISPKKWDFEDDVPFPQMGYVNFLEGICFFEPKKHLPATGTLSSVQWSLSDRHLGSLCEGAVSPRRRLFVGWFFGPIKKPTRVHGLEDMNLTWFAILDVQVFASQNKSTTTYVHLFSSLLY